MYVFRRSFSTVHPTLGRQGTSKGGELPASMDCPFHYGLLLFTGHRLLYKQHTHSTRLYTVQYDYELVDLL